MALQHTSRRWRWQSSWVKPFPQNLAFRVVVADADEEGRSEMAQRVSMMLRRCLSVRVFLLTGVPTFCCCKLLELVEHGLLDVLVGIRMTSRPGTKAAR